jgi:hypothetical protein
MHLRKIFYLLCCIFLTSLIHSLIHKPGRAIAQAVSRWLPTAAARVRPRVWSSGICGGQSGAGVGFLRVLRFPLPNHSTKFSILTITRGRYNRPINGRRADWTQFGLHPPLCKLKKKEDINRLFFYNLILLLRARSPLLIKPQFWNTFLLTPFGDNIMYFKFSNFPTLIEHWDEI